MLKNQVIESQQSMVRGQAEFSSCKTERIETLKRNYGYVSLMEMEFKSYSSAVQKFLTARTSISSETLRMVVNDVVKKSGPRHKVVLFGLERVKGSQLNDEVSKVFETPGNKS